MDQYIYSRNIISFSSFNFHQYTISSVTRTCLYLNFKWTWNQYHHLNLLIFIFSHILLTKSCQLYPLKKKSPEKVEKSEHKSVSVPESYIAKLSVTRNAEGEWSSSSSFALKNKTITTTKKKKRRREEEVCSRQKL